MANDSIGLTVFLLKKDQEQAFDSRYPPTDSTALPLANGTDGRFIPLPSQPSTPRWATAIRGLLATPTALNVRSQSPAGLLVLPRGGRTFVITFGYAWMKLEDAWVERDFGRRVALNLINADGLVEIRTEQVFAKWHVASDRAPRASSVDEFGVEFDRDLVAVVEGVPLDASLGKSVRGGTSLRLNVPVDGLIATLDKAEALFLSDAYKKHWPEIDNLSPVKGQELVSDLEAQLDAELASGAAQTRLVMCTPTYRRDDPLVVDSYVFGRLTKSPAKRPYLTVHQWLDHLADRGLDASVENAKGTSIHLFDEDGSEPRTCSVFDCFGYELSLGGEQYILSSGVWYKAAPDFIKRINTAVSKIGKSPVVLPTWNQTDTEGEYNAKCGAQDGFLFFDAKNVSFGGGHSRFEFCDVMHPESRTLLFAKIASKSSGMSHLVEQVRRTSELVFSADPAFRKKLKRIVEKNHPTTDTSWLDSRPRPSDWHLCLVSLGKAKQHLPFFAKCGLTKLYGEMRERGHDVSFTHV